MSGTANTALYLRCCQRKTRNLRRTMSSTCTPKHRTRTETQHRRCRSSFTRIGSRLVSPDQPPDTRSRYRSKSLGKSFDGSMLSKVREAYTAIVKSLDPEQTSDEGE